jgi:hypothetical protein
MVVMQHRSPLRIVAVGGHHPEDFQHMGQIARGVDLSTVLILGTQVVTAVGADVQSLRLRVSVNRPTTMSVMTYEPWSWIVA